MLKGLLYTLKDSGTRFLSVDNWNCSIFRSDFILNSLLEVGGWRMVVVLVFFSDVLCWEELIQSCVFSVIQQNITLCCISQWCSNVRLHCVNVVHRRSQCVMVNLWWIHNLFTCNGCVQLRKISDSVSMQPQLPANRCATCISMLLDWAETLVMNTDILTQLTSVNEVSVRSYLVALLTAIIVDI